MPDLVKLADIAGAIHAHLRRLESRQNTRRELETASRRAGSGALLNDITALIERHGLKDLRWYGAGASAAGRFVKVRYVSYHGHVTLSKDEALAYLRALDLGYVGEHWHMKA